MAAKNSGALPKRALDAAVAGRTIFVFGSLGRNLGEPRDAWP